MTENNRPWDFNKIKTGINPEIKDMMNYNAKLRTDMSSMLSSSFKDMHISGLSLYSGAAVNTADMITRSALSMRKTIENVTQPISAIAHVNESITQIRENLMSLPQEALVPSSAIESIKEALNTQHANNITRWVENMKQVSAFELATSLSVANTVLSNNITATDVETNIVDETAPVEIPRDVVHEKLKKEAEKEQEEISAEVPYNVLSMDFIYAIFIPCISIADALENAETFDMEFAVRFIVFTVIPFIYGLAILNKREETKEVHFDRDVTLTDEKDNGGSLR